MITAREFEVLAVTLRPKLVSSALPVVREDALAEDVAQDTLLKLWTIRNDLDRYRSVEALAMVMARHIAINATRGRRPQYCVELNETMATVQSPEEEMMQHEYAGYIDSVLASLPENSRTLITMRHIEGYDNQTIAAILGTSEGAVRTALSRARKRIAECFGIDS